jgi:hypothetical protein
MKNIRFREFLLTENTNFLGQRVGDVLSALQDLKDNTAGMGKRQATAASESIVNQIRTILHINWNKKDVKSLIHLQKVGVAISKAIEEKDDLDDVLASSIDELQKMTQKLGVPINKLGSPEEAPNEAQPTIAPPEGKTTPTGKKMAPQPPQGQQQPPQGQESTPPQQ